MTYDSREEREKAELWFWAYVLTLLAALIAYGIHECDGGAFGPKDAAPAAPVVEVPHGA